MPEELHPLAGVRMRVCSSATAAGPGKLPYGAWPRRRQGWEWDEDGNQEGVLRAAGWGGLKLQPWGMRVLLGPDARFFDWAIGRQTGS